MAAMASTRPSPTLPPPPQSVTRLDCCLELEVTAAVDVSSPRGASSSSRARILRMELSDGSRSFSAFEYRPLPAATGVGARLRLTRPQMCHGFLLLEPQTAELLSPSRGGGGNAPCGWASPLHIDPSAPPPRFSPLEPLHLDPSAPPPRFSPPEPPPPPAPEERQRPSPPHALPAAKPSPTPREGGVLPTPTPLTTPTPGQPRTSTLGKHDPPSTLGKHDPPSGVLVQGHKPRGQGVPTASTLTPGRGRGSAKGGGASCGAQGRGGAAKPAPTRPEGKSSSNSVNSGRAPPLDPELVEELCAAGLTIEEVYAQLGISAGE
ncbi:hypothetical protein AB1Y20_007765 [Prymnesium parvum]|uniref:RecQ mediated genome instability protein 1 OB-fold domain-containing protein n=1 Tax=Prymnesium parvum TaxID=97485 RepID=A0AB34IVW4_PRYPA